MRTIAAWLILCAAAVAQITVPAESEPYKIIEASVKANIPQGATIDGGATCCVGCDHVLTFDKKAARDAGLKLLEMGSQ